MQEENYRECRKQICAGANAERQNRYTGDTVSLCDLSLYHSGCDKATRNVRIEVRFETNERGNRMRQREAYGSADDRRR